MELYIHIPFCVRKCDYCDFLSGPASPERQAAYLEALKNEIRLTGRWHREQERIRQTEGQANLGIDRPADRLANRQGEISSVFIGGGTPSAVAAGQIAAILELVRESFRLTADAEITMEANPGTLTGEKLRIYRRAGINRLSIGLQSADDGELRLLGRIHTWQEFRENYQAAREAGFANINIDLMSALPGQTVASWERTLRKTVDCQPEHISAYSLILEEGTPFFRRYADHPEALPDEDSDREMYHLTKELLAGAGYERYEISNYSKPGYACRHNMGYWRRIPYLGLGLGASSLYQESRFHNTADMARYIRCLSGACGAPNRLFSGSDPGRMPDPEQEWEPLEQIREETEALSAEDRMEEFMFLGLRLTEGIRETAFAGQFGRTLDSVYGSQLLKLTAAGLMERTEAGYRLTDWGLDVSNQVFAEFLLS